MDQINQLGIASGIAQMLKGPLTSIEKLLENNDQILLLCIQTNRVIGLLKYGYKDLYCYTPKGQMKQMTHTLSLLDFFVIEEVQRHGIGKQLFDWFLLQTNILPQRIAYDRPSPKLFPFLSRHYQLQGGDIQPNRFAIFPGFFDENK